jgi:hypothetical protein
MEPSVEMLSLAASEMAKPRQPVFLTTADLKRALFSPMPPAKNKRVYFTFERDVIAPNKGANTVHKKVECKSVLWVLCTIGSCIAAKSLVPARVERPDSLLRI